MFNQILSIVNILGFILNAVPYCQEQWKPPLNLNFSEQKVADEENGAKDYLHSHKLCKHYTIKAFCSFFLTVGRYAGTAPPSCLSTIPLTRPSTAGLDGAAKYLLGTVMLLLRSCATARGNHEGPHVAAAAKCSILLPSSHTG